MLECFYQNLYSYQLERIKKILRVGLRASLHQIFPIQAPIIKKNILEDTNLISHILYTCIPSTQNKCL